jgi:acyl dehydratase
MLIASSDMTSSVVGGMVVLSIKRSPAEPIGALGLRFPNCVD